LTTLPLATRVMKLPQHELLSANVLGEGLLTPPLPGPTGLQSPVLGEGLLTPPLPGPTGLLESRGFAAL